MWASRERLPDGGTRVIGDSGRSASSSPCELLMSSVPALLVVISLEKEVAIVVNGLPFGFGRTALFSGAQPGRAPPVEVQKTAQHRPHRPSPDGRRPWPAGSWLSPTACPSAGGAGPEGGLEE